jgi:Transmembrane domain of unknown function (DUF3566)
LDRRTNTSDGSGGASPTVVTERDDDDDLTAEEDQPTQILGTSSLRAAAKSANGNAADEKDAAVEDVPALPADSIGSPRDSFTFSQSASASTDAAADRTPTSSPPAETIPAEAIPAEAEPASVGTGTEWPAAGTPLDTGATAERSAGDPAPADSPRPSGSPETSGVSAAAFVWDPPEPADTSASSPARNFLRSSASATASDPPRTPAVSVGPAKEPTSHAVPSAASGASTRSKRSSRRSARQAHLTIARVEPWSVMKFSFVVSLVAFVILFVAVGVIYGTLSAIGVFTSLQHVVQSVTSSQNSNGLNTSHWFTASRVLSYTALLGALNIVLITAMATIGAVVYNLTSRLIGGVEVTLRETE